jgi:hypothetical protein
MRMLDNVIDINFYPTEDTKRSNMRHRPVGLGLRGLQDALYKTRASTSTPTRQLNFRRDPRRRSATTRSSPRHSSPKSAASYETYKGSKWDRGILPQDTIALLEAERGTQNRRAAPRDPRLAPGARSCAPVGHAQLQHHGSCADRNDRQHRRLLPDHRADLQKSLR